MSGEKRSKIPRPLMFLALFEIVIPLAALCVDGWDPYRPHRTSSNLIEFVLNLMYGVHILVSGPAIILSWLVCFALLPVFGSLFSLAGPMTYGVTMCVVTIGEWLLIYQCFKGEDIRWRWSAANRKGKVEGCLWGFGFAVIWLVTGYVHLMVWLLGAA